MRKKRKLIIVLIFVLIFIALCFVIYYFLKPNTIIQSELSDRALEYLEKGVGDFEDINLKPKIKRIDEKIEVKGCFSFIFPFELTTFREQEECNWLYNSTNPITRVVVRLRDINISNLDDLPDVKLRVGRSDKYEMTSKVINNDTYYIFEKVDDGYEISAFALFGKKVLSISLTSQINRGLMSEFENMLGSLEVRL